MNKTKTINRLFLGTVVWILAASFGIGFLPFTRNLTAELLLVLSQILYLMPVAVFILAAKVKPWEWMPFKPIMPSTIAMTVLYTMLLMPLVSWLNLISMLFVKNAFASSQAELTANPFWLNLFVMAVIPAVFEEFTFRGLYYKAYRQRGVWCAILGSALVFGLIHMNFNQFCYAFALGVAFGLLLEATGSIFATMTAHFTVNGWNVLLMALTRNMEGTAVAAEAETELTADMLVAAIGVYTVMAAVCTCLAGAVLVWIAKHCGRLPHLKWCFHRRKRREGEPRTMLTVPFVIAMIVLVVFMVIAG